MLKRIFVLPAVGIILSACNTMHAIEGRSERQEVTRYCSELAQNPVLQPLVGKLPMFTAQDITAEMMARRDVPTAAEIPLLRTWLQNLDLCRARWIALFRDYAPAQSPPLQGFYFRINLLIAKLLNREITYGNANVLALESYVAYSHEAGEVAQRDAEIRAANSRALLNASVQLLTAAERQRPQTKVTNCSWFGNTLNCVTQ